MSLACWPLLARFCTTQLRFHAIILEDFSGITLIHTVRVIGKYWTECQEPSLSKEWSAMPLKWHDSVSVCSFCAAVPLSMIQTRPNSGTMLKSRPRDVAEKRRQPRESL